MEGVITFGLTLPATLVILLMLLAFSKSKLVKNVMYVFACICCGWVIVAGSAAIIYTAVTILL